MGTLNGSFSYAIPSELVVYGGWLMFFVENRFQFHRLWQHVERDKKLRCLSSLNQFYAHLDATWIKTVQSLS